jgi:hypothetical protein
VVPALVTLALAAQAATAPSGTPVERQREEIAKEIVRIGTAVRREVIAGDARAIAARVPEDGLRCAGRVVPRARVERDLATPGTWLHDTLFGRTPAVRSGSPRSLAELLRSSPEIAMAVSFVRDPRAGEVGRPCLEFRAKDAVTPGTPLCFELRAGRWWLSESLYPCG